MIYLDNHSGDVGVTIDGCDTILSVPWQDIINYSHTIMFFGKPFDQSRPWTPVCRFKNNQKYALHIFHQIASEYFGNLRTSLQLFAVYKECLCSVYRVRCVAIKKCPHSTMTKQGCFKPSLMTCVVICFLIASKFQQLF